jgi:DNA polymerase III delta prime subunit
VLRLYVDDNQHTLRLKALESVVRERHSLPWVAPVLASGKVAPLASSGWDPPAELGLTEGQRRAVIGATRCQDVFLIQGPPGTGKTTVIAALIRYFAGERGLRVLLSAKGHRAIDNALDRLDSADLHVLRLGQAAKVTGAGQDILLSAVVARAEQDVPRRHAVASAALQNAVQVLELAEQTLAQLATLDRGIVESEAAIALRVAEIERALAPRLQAIREERVDLARRVAAVRAGLDEPNPGAHEYNARRSLTSVAGTVRALVRRLRQRQERRALRELQDRQRFCNDTEDWVQQARRFYSVRQDLAAIREHLATLREDRHRLALRAEAIMPVLPAQVPSSWLPPLPVGSPDRTVESLAAVRRARQRAQAALRASRAWQAAIAQPGTLADLLVDTADVVAATAMGVSSGRDGARTASLEYDVAIIDEAGQAHLSDLVVALSRARKVILVGDHQQLTPYVDEDLLRRCRDRRLDTAWLEKSLFECLWDHVPETHRTRLNVQFRMPEAIAGFLGRAFYEGDYASAPTRQGGGPVCELFRAPVVLVDTSGQPDRGETALSPGYLNRCEARLVAEIAARLPERFRADEGLGVIAPYGAQVAAVRQSLADVFSLSPRDPWLTDNVATVDSFQGQERDVIIVSLTRSNTEGSVGFLSDLHRLNVTLSRARQQLVIIGDLSTLTAQGGSTERRAFARFARDLAYHVRQHGELLTAEELGQRLARG